MHKISDQFGTSNLLRNMIDNGQGPSQDLDLHPKILISVNKNVHALSKVYLGNSVAVKKYNAEDLCIHDIEKIEDEIFLLKQLNHQGVMNLLSTFVSGTKIAYTMPFMECGSCQDLMENKFTTGLPECWIALIVKNVLEALNFIHKNGIIHRAIKARHILLKPDGRIKLTGFRYAFKKLFDNYNDTVYDFPYDTVPNLKWLSPEILKQDRLGYTEKSDVYSLGMTICELANGRPPFENLEPKKLLLDKLSCVVPLIFDSSTHLDFIPVIESLSVPTEQLDVYSTRSISNSLHSLKNICCISNYDQRPNIDDLMDNDFFIEFQQCDFAPCVLPLIKFKSLEDIDDVESIEWNF